MNNIDYFTCDINGMKRNGKNITSEEYDKIMKDTDESRRITGAAILIYVILYYSCYVFFVLLLIYCLYKLF